MTDTESEAGQLKPLARDLGLIDQFDGHLIQNFLCGNGICRIDRTSFHVFKLVQRDVTAVAKINAITRMSNEQLLKLTELARRQCSEHELEVYSPKVA